MKVVITEKYFVKAQVLLYQHEMKLLLRAVQFWRKLIANFSALHRLLNWRIIILQIRFCSNISFLYYNIRRISNSLQYFGYYMKYFKYVSNKKSSSSTFYCILQNIGRHIFGSNERKNNARRMSICYTWTFKWYSVSKLMNILTVQFLDTNQFICLIVGSWNNSHSF